MANKRRWLMMLMLAPGCMSAMYAPMRKGLTLTKKEKREYRAIRSAVFAHDPDYAQTFNSLYPHIINVQSIKALVYHNGSILSVDGDMNVSIDGVEYSISSGLANLIREDNPYFDW